MKSPTKLLTIVGLAWGAASLAFAGPGVQYYQTLRNESQFKELKPADKIVYVCNQCKTVTEVVVESTTQAMEHCKEAATVTCPACKKTVKVVVKTKRDELPSHNEIVYVNEKGEECLFIAKVKVVEKK